MLSLIELSKSHTDLELYGTDTSIAPIDKVHIIDEDSFEQFTLEWLFGCKKMKYSFIKRIGGAGDKGRDVVGYYNNGAVDYYQCKHYNTGISLEFQLYIMIDYRRLKTDENSRLYLNWNLNRKISKLNYRIHTDTIKDNLVPPAN